MEPLSPATGGSVRARGRILTRYRTAITPAHIAFVFSRVTSRHLAVGKRPALNFRLSR